MAIILSGCSSNQVGSDEAIEKTDCQIAVEKAEELTNKAELTLERQGREAARPNTLLVSYYILEKEECFNAETVAQAKTLISIAKK